MSLFQRPHYTSETTDFITTLKTQRPSLEKEQLAGRALLWDKQVDRKVQQEFKAGRVAQQPYVYQTKA
ncbi:DUF3460 family protein [Curvibacter sp. CHRR-16]|uniref:DUF3460 family protein n=1 Tax=Curvibacter sp. CHRR-16 TaxID=2835872 RepID=UPI001BD9BB51|nr:DUF3460 family protein [Curvibacter sp. CHRR-16]MBT0568863.1 DUF3460 family protein [Curvibacter sp. CHRR-16]